MHKLIDQLRQFRDKRDWQQFHTPKDLAISISVEAAELLELFQWRSATEEPDHELLDKVRSEAADVLIYLLFLSDVLGIDLEEAARAKIERNEKRFPVATSRGIAKPNDTTGAQ